MALALGALWVWSVYEKAVTAHYSKKYRTVPLPAKPNYDPRNVSIVVPTIDTEPTFTECVRLWLKSKPREIIIVTVPRNKSRVVRLVEPLQEIAGNRIIILTAALANKRQQLIIGVRAARGQICALVDDDVYWSDDIVLPYLLAPFEDSKVGAVAGIQSAEIPPERQDARVFTAWEAAATYDMYQMKNSREVHFAADGGCWCLSGRTLLVRTIILQDQDFDDAFTHELIGRRIVNTADDVFVTEWVFDHGWKVSIQNAPEAEVTTNIPRDHKFAWQVLRWERGNVRAFLARMFVYPGYRTMMQRHPYSTRKMVERLARPVWALASISIWLRTLWTTPWIAYAYIGWVIFGWCGWISTYGAFLEMYPYCKRQVWALLLMDHIGPILDIYVYLTMNNDNWLTRAADTQDVETIDGVGKDRIMSMR